MTRHADPDVLTSPAPVPDPPDAALWRRAPTLLLLGSVLIAGSAPLGLKVMTAVTLTLTAALLTGTLLLTRQQERRAGAWVYAAAGELTGRSRADLNAHLARLSTPAPEPWMPPLLAVVFAPALLLALPPVIVAALVLAWGALAARGAQQFAARFTREEQASVLREALLRLE